MSVTDAEAVRGLVIVLFSVLSGCVTAAWYGLKSILRRFDELAAAIDSSRTEMVEKIDALKDEYHTELRGLDRRITRVEARILLHTPSPTEESGGYDGPERRK